MVVAQATTSITAAALFEAHMQAELNGDLDATMATMVEDPHLINLASGTGGRALKGCVSSTPPS
jgi:carboxymethylenebutenolidase